MKQISKIATATKSIKMKNRSLVIIMTFVSGGIKTESVNHSTSAV